MSSVRSHDLPSHRRLARLTLLSCALPVACSTPVPTTQTGTTEPASVEISPSSETFDALSATSQFTATVLDAAGGTLSGQTVTWTSSAGTIASVTTNGLVTALQNGSAMINAAAGSVSNGVPVTVAQVATALTVTPPSSTIGVGANVTVAANVVDANAFAVAGAALGFVSRNPGVATVDGSGVVLGIAAGNTYVVASSGGLSDSAAITVTTQNPTPSVLLFTEGFEDANLQSRGWYDNTAMTLSTSEKKNGTRSLMIQYNQGSSLPTFGLGPRHLFTETETVYLSYWVKYSTNWTGAGGPTAHPHEFSFMTNYQGDYDGGAFTALTVYVEHNWQSGGIPYLRAQDGRNIDQSAINQDLTNVTENRSIAGCNGNTDGHPSNCYLFTGPSTYNNGKSWAAAQPFFLDTPGSNYKNDWHFIEAQFKMNSVQAGVGMTDGSVQYWFDGQLIIDHQNVLLRTGTRADQRFKQLLISPFIGNGAPAGQTAWIDDLTVRTGRP